LNYTFNYEGEGTLAGITSYVEMRINFANDVFRRSAKTSSLLRAETWWAAVTRMDELDDSTCKMYQYL
jgi:hypothetical protein